MAEKHKKPIENDISDRITNLLRAFGIRFIGDLTQITAIKLSKSINDDVIFNEIKNSLADMGLTFKPEKVVSGMDCKVKLVDEIGLSMQTETTLKNAKIVTI